MKKLLSNMMCLAMLALLAACDNTVNLEPVDTVYLGGSILTMEGDAPQYVEVLAVKDGKIRFVGTLANFESQFHPSRRVDLAGKALLPGFIDAHGHVFNAGFQKLAANLLPPPDGQGSDIASVLALLKEWQDRNATAIEKSGWIIGFGYDDSQLAELRHPVADELDQVSTEVPVLVIHQSGHLAAMNHKGLELAGFTEDTPDPAGGVIRREVDGKTPNGVLEEMAFFGPVFKVLGALDQEANERIAIAGLEAYSQFGFTTAQEGRASAEASEVWRSLAEQDKLTLDVAVYPDIQAAADYVEKAGVSSQYTNHFRIAGVKISLDGSPQGKTAWLSEAYKVPPQGMPDSYAGYPAIPDANQRQALIDQAFSHGWQILAHCNGDAASEAFIDAIEKAAEAYGNVDRRTVMIHAQTVREDQLDRMQVLGIMPSFFTMHTYYWGDWHRDETLGKERAYRISPTASALARNMKFTTHHDAPVALPSALMILHTTVNRSSRSGDVIGPDQRVSTYIGLKSLTEWAAWQYFEEASKGTLKSGKLADLVILDQDPLQVKPDVIRDITVVETIKEGKTVYLRADK